MTLAFSAGDVAYWGLAIFLVLLGVGSIFALLKLGQLFDRISSFVQGAERDVLPVVVKTGGTVDRVNYQLDKLDTVTDSAVSMADSADTAVRAVSTAITTPVEKVSGVAAGIAHGFSSLRKTKKLLRGEGRGEGRGATPRAGPRGGPAGRRAHAALRGAADADADADPGAEAGPVAPAAADAEARSGARAAGRAALAPPLDRREGPRRGHETNERDAAVDVRGVSRRVAGVSLAPAQVGTKS